MVRSKGWGWGIEAGGERSRMRRVSSEGWGWGVSGFLINLGLDYIIIYHYDYILRLYIYNSSLSLAMLLLQQGYIYIYPWRLYNYIYPDAPQNRSHNESSDTLGRSIYFVARSILQGIYSDFWFGPNLWDLLIWGSIFDFRCVIRRGECVFRRWREVV